MKKLRSKLGLIAGLLVFLAGSGALVWFLVLSPGARAEVAPPPPEAKAKTYTLDQFLTNLADEGSRRILRVSMELLVVEDSTVRELDRQRGQVRSEILALLRSRYLADLEGERGMMRLAADIVERINAILGTGGVLRVYFTDFIIQ